ncbi:MAG: hypothetical protein HRT74_02860 [Flavobacteriales bacterium]|nr:hypothetical protein [Flavobacteriales bacterium]
MRALLKYPALFVLIRLISLVGISFILGAAFGLGLLFINEEETFKASFPNRLFIASVVLSIFIYIVGIALERLYQVIWSKKVELHEWEKNFFLASGMVILIVYGFGLIIFVVHEVQLLEIGS